MLVTIGTQRVKATCLIQTPVDVDNGHLFLAQSTDSHRVNLANADTSLSATCCNRPFLFQGKMPSIDSVSMFLALQYTT